MISALDRLGHAGAIVLFRQERDQCGAVDEHSRSLPPEVIDLVARHEPSARFGFRMQIVGDGKQALGERLLCTFALDLGLERANDRLRHGCAAPAREIAGEFCGAGVADVKRHGQLLVFSGMLVIALRIHGIYPFVNANVVILPLQTSLGRGRTPTKPAIVAHEMLQHRCDEAGWID